MSNGQNSNSRFSWLSYLCDSPRITMLWRLLQFIVGFDACIYGGKCSNVQAIICDNSKPSSKYIGITNSVNYAACAWYVVGSCVMQLRDRVCFYDSASYICWVCASAPQLKFISQNVHLSHDLWCHIKFFVINYMRFVWRILYLYTAEASRDAFSCSHSVYIRAWHKSFCMICEHAILSESG